ncbi:MAG: hypothetical protein WCH40_03175 [Verrucomicrobiales bacterium]
MPLFEPLGHPVYYLLGNHDDVLHQAPHCITFRPILHQPETNAWTNITVHDDRLVIEGHGREISRDLPFRS